MHYLWIIFLYQGSPFEEVAKKYNIGVTTVKDLLKKQSEIESAVEKNRHFGLVRKTLRGGT